MTETDLHRVFRSYLPDVHWQRIESWMTGVGTPDTNYCLNSHEGWIENKVTSTWTVSFRAGQPAWIERRCRAGGRVWIVVRRKTVAGPRKGAAVDELLIFSGERVREVRDQGLKSITPNHRFAGGPASWDWEAIRRVLMS